MQNKHSDSQLDTHLSYVRAIKIADFDYYLPDERIARHPEQNRDACRLLMALPEQEISHHRFSDLPDLLPSGSLLVCNDTRVINARIKFRKETGSQIEIFLLEPVDPDDYVLTFQTRENCRWSCLVGNLKRWKHGALSKKLVIDGREVILEARLGAPRPGNAFDVEFSWNDPEVTFASIVEAAGYIPIPPYLKRDSEVADASDYQTVYARVKGSVAAPTAGLHFTESLFSRLEEKGIRKSPLTLHVGAGTFQPVKSEEIGRHPMHTEVFSISRRLIDDLIRSRKEGRNVIAVGTTSVRTLESIPYLGKHLSEGTDNMYVDQWEPYGDNASFDTDASLEAVASYMDEHALSSLTASTSIMIAPGFRWRIVDIMITNFHQPQSTLLLLVSSFLDRNVTGKREKPRWLEIYEQALAEDYRFLSYGDACLFFS